LAKPPHIPAYFAAAVDWPTPVKDTTVLWSDNHSDIFSLLRWEQSRPRVVVIESPAGAATPAVPVPPSTGGEKEVAE
jgi:hypothetical protein